MGYWDVSLRLQIGKRVYIVQWDHKYYYDYTENIINNCTICRFFISVSFSERNSKIHFVFNAQRKAQVSIHNTVAILIKKIFYGHWKLCNFIITFEYYFISGNQGWSLYYMDKKSFSASSDAIWTLNCGGFANEFLRMNPLIYIL